MVEVRKVMDHYEIYIDGEFEISCDVNELRETLNSLK